MKPRNGGKANLGFGDTDSFTVCIKTEDSHVDIAKDAETRFDTSNYELDK